MRWFLSITLSLMYWLYYLLKGFSSGLVKNYIEVTGLTPESLNSFIGNDCRRKGCETKNHEKQCVFHGFLSFKGQNQVFFENG